MLPNPPARRCPIVPFIRQPFLRRTRMCRRGMRGSNGHTILPTPWLARPPPPACSPTPFSCSQQQGRTRHVGPCTSLLWAWLCSRRRVSGACMCMPSCYATCCSASSAVAQERDQDQISTNTTNTTTATSQPPPSSPRSGLKSHPHG